MKPQTETPPPPALVISRGYEFRDPTATRYVAGVVEAWLSRHKITRHRFARDENDNLVAIADPVTITVGSSLTIGTDG